VLAQWPLRCIRSYECTGRGRFTLETGSHAAHGAGCYVLHTRAGQDGVLYDKIDTLVSELAALHDVSDLFLSGLKFGISKRVALVTHYILVCTKALPKKLLPCIKVCVKEN